MSTPLYRALKQNGTTVYAFPGAEEDINQQAPNFKINFSKFVLLNLPKSQINSDTEPKYWDIENVFYSSSNNETTDFGDKVVNSLRNYVANQEVVIRETKVDDNNFFYENSLLKTNTERLFWKWCRKLNIIDFELAIDGDEYFGDLDEFDSNDQNDTEYFKEFLWKERETPQDSISSFYESPTVVGKLEVEFEGSINYRVGDFVNFVDVENINFPEIVKYAQVTSITVPSGTDGYKVIFDINYNGNEQTESNGYAQLVYDRLVQYIGEVQGNNNVVSQNTSYDQILAFLGDTAGSTPDILFRTTFDDNYKPSLQFPILNSQFQPEILGGENFNSPIVNNPTNYPGDQYAQYDNDDNLNEYTYLSSTGDFNRKSGDYFGAFGNTNNATFDSSNLDGLNVDFDTNHYVKMNILNNELRNFDEFNTEQINGQFPENFDFNAILWYYDVEDANGNISTNLYGISLIDNPDNDPTNPGDRFPKVRKLAANNDQDGTAYQFALNRYTKLTTEQPQPQFSNEFTNNLFGFNLYNEVMRRLITFNDSASRIISENKAIYDQVEGLRQLVYTNGDISNINSQIQNLTNLIRLYNTNQMVSSDTIEVEKDNSKSPPEIKLNSIEAGYKTITEINTINLYNDDGNIPQAILVPNGKDFLVRIINDDNVDQTLPDEEKLNVYLNTDLAYKQKVDIIVDGSLESTENKRLDIFISYQEINATPVFKEVRLGVDLPVYFNASEQAQNTAYNWKNIDERVNSFQLNSDGETISINVNRTAGLLKGDTIILENVYLGTEDPISIDGQYLIDSIENGNTINVDFSQNANLNAYIVQEITDSNLSNGDTITTYNSLGVMKFNKGYKISVVRVDELDSSSFEDRYLITVDPLN